MTRFFSRQETEVQRAWVTRPGSDFTQGPSAPGAVASATRLHGWGLGELPSRAPGLPAGASLHTSQEAPASTGEDAQAVPTVPPLGAGLVFTCTQAAQAPGHCCQRWWCPCLKNVPWSDRPLCCTFSFPGAHSQALSQVRPRPGHRTVEMFLGTQLQSSCFHKEEREERKAPNDHQAGSENEPLSALSQLWTQGLASASQLVNGAAGKVQS